MNGTKPRKVLLIGWDGADWEHINPLLDEGLLPNLEGLISRGVMGNLATLQPVLSPMLWNSIATGKLADKHGIHGFMEVDPERQGARPVSSLSRKCKAIWNILSQSGYRSNVVSWWASHPAEPVNGAIVTNMFNQVKREPLRIPPGTIHPVDLAEEIADLRVEPGELTAADLLPFVQQAAKVDQNKDGRLGAVAKILSDCASTQAAATALMEEQDWDFTAIYFDAIDHFCHGFADFHPPRRPHISEEMYEMYKDVIRTAYRFHDIMLAKQLELAGRDALVLVCSDHGFHIGEHRPITMPREPAGPAVWHRDMGMFVMSGPGIKRDARVYGANIIDMTPTLLVAMGLPVGADMDGRVLLDVFEESRTPEVIPSWEDVSGDAGMHPSGTRIDAEWSEELTRQFVALGYVEDHSGNREKAEQSAKTESDYNLARVYFSSRRYMDALPLFESLVQEHPWEERFIQHLIVTLKRSGHARQTLALMENAYPEGGVPANLVLTRVAAVMATEGREQAMELFNAISADALKFPALQREVGMILRGLGRLEEAAEVLQGSVELDTDDYFARGELAKVYLKQRRWEEAADQALESVARLHQQPEIHSVLGQALLRLGDNKHAEQAFLVALAMRPGMRRVHGYLNYLYRWLLNDPGAAVRHGHSARVREGDVKTGARASQEDRTHRTWSLPSLPTPAERWEKLCSERESPQEREQRKGSSGKTFVIVSGLPRSGTSLMMQMLQAGGLDPQTDQIREADVDNPRGYWEWEALKKHSDLTALFDETEGLEGRAIKAVSMLLPTLPLQHCYKVVMMMRPVEEVALSQAKMIQRLGSSGARGSEGELRGELWEHRQQILSFLSKQSHIEVLPVRYRALIEDPVPACDLLAKFLGERLPNPERMAAVIDPALYRQRTNGGPDGEVTAPQAEGEENSG